MQRELSWLQRQGFLLPEPTPESLALRLSAAEVSLSLRGGDRVSAVFLAGSAIVGNAGSGSDIDLSVVVKRAPAPLRKMHFGATIADIEEFEESAFLRDFASGENAKYLTHTVFLYDPSGAFRSMQRRVLRAYYSEKEMSKETERVKRILDERARFGLSLVQQGHLCEAALALDSCFLEAASLLIRRQHGVASISLLLDEIFRIGYALGRPDWERRAVRCLRLDCSPRRYRQLIQSNDQMLSLMRGKLSKNDSLARRLKRLRLKEPLPPCALLETMCTETNAQQVRDKVERALAAKRPHQAGLSLLYEYSFDFFVFSPFFYLKNANAHASAREIQGHNSPDLLKHWDSDVRKAWKAMSQADRLTRSKLVELSKLSTEILQSCQVR